MIRVAQTINSISWRSGGVSEVVRALSRALQSYPDMTVEVHSIADPHSAVDQSDWSEVSLKTHPPFGPRSLGLSYALTNSLLAADSDIVHVHALWQGQTISVRKLHALTGIPFVVSPHGMLDPWALRVSGWKKRIAGTLYENNHLRNAFCLHALCEAEINAIRSYGLTNPICLIPNGVHIPDLEIRDENSQEFYSADLAIGEGKNILLFLGRIHPKKGLVNAIKGWAKMRNREWQFVIAGWDENGHSSELQRLCDELEVPYMTTQFMESPDPGDSDIYSSGQRNTNTHTGPGNFASIVFTGSVFGAEKDSLLRRAKAFILPSFSEGLPVAVLEAWSYSLPVIMTDECNLPVGFTANAAVRIEPEVESIATAMNTLFSMTPRERESIGEAGRLLVIKRFSWPKIAQQMKDVYSWILGGSSPETIVH